LIVAIANDIINDWYFFVRVAILGNFDGALRQDINSVSQGGGSTLYRQEDGCKTDLKKLSESHIGTSVDWTYYFQILQLSEINSLVIKNIQTIRTLFYMQNMLWSALNTAFTVVVSSQTMTEK